MQCLLAFAVLKFNMQAVFNANFHLKRQDHYTHLMKTSKYSTPIFVTKVMQIGAIKSYANL